jgi:ribosomal protein S18 acetylase RimI-like enzyme
VTASLEAGTLSHIVHQDPATRLKPATAADKDFIRHLFKIARADDFACVGLPAPALDTLIEQQFLAQRRGYAARFPNAVSLIVMHRDEPVGRFILDACDRRWHIIDIVLLPSARGQGIGSDLIDAAAQADGASELHLSVLFTNLAARRLYGRLGFVATSGDDSHIAMVRRFDR